MQEIEVPAVSMWKRRGYMTATLMCQSDKDKPKTTAVTFILSGIGSSGSVRRAAPFMIVAASLPGSCPRINGDRFDELLDAVIDRAAISRRIGSEVIRVSRDISSGTTRHAVIRRSESDRRKATQSTS